MTTQQERKNDSIADENTPFRSAAGVAVAKAAVRDVRTVINKYIVVRSSGLLFLSFFLPPFHRRRSFLPHRLNFLIFLFLSAAALLYYLYRQHHPSRNITVLLLAFH